MELKATETKLCQRGLIHNIDGGEKGKKWKRTPPRLVGRSLPPGLISTAYAVTLLVGFFRPCGKGHNIQLLATLF